MKKLKIKKTSRGFSYIDFKDEREKMCSIQKSSLADKDCIWFGINESDVEPKMFIYGKGWTQVPFPEGTSFNSRMHLTREQVKEILPILKKFVKTGEVK